MASIVYGDQSMAGAMVYQPMSNALSDFIDTTNRYMSEKLSDFGRQFVARTRSVRERLGFDRIMAVREQADRSMRRLYMDDDIRALITYDDLVQARSKMRRYILAEPILRKLYREKKLSGWDNSVKDDITRPVDQTPEYLHATNGVLIDNHDRYTYNEELEMYEELEPLSISEKADILYTWEQAKSIIQMDNLDPTSLWGASI